MDGPAKIKMITARQTAEMAALISGGRNVVPIETLRSDKNVHIASGRLELSIGFHVRLRIFE